MCFLQQNHSLISNTFFVIAIGLSSIYLFVSTLWWLEINCPSNNFSYLFLRICKRDDHLRVAIKSIFFLSTLRPSPFARHDLSFCFFLSSSFISSSDYKTISFPYFYLCLSSLSNSYFLSFSSIRVCSFSRIQQTVSTRWAFANARKKINCFSLWTLTVRFTFSSEFQHPGAP